MVFAVPRGGTLGAAHNKCKSNLFTGPISRAYDEPVGLRSAADEALQQLQRGFRLLFLGHVSAILNEAQT